MRQAFVRNGPAGETIFLVCGREREADLIIVESIPRKSGIVVLITIVPKEGQPAVRMPAQAWVDVEVIVLAARVDHAGGGGLVIVVLVAGGKREGELLQEDLAQGDAHAG